MLHPTTDNPRRRSSPTADPPQRRRIQPPAGSGPRAARRSRPRGAMNLGLLLWYSVPMALAAIGMLT
ncbi:hypothetical protein KMT30_36930, partial [Streptomyces sp. IBSBF 2953]|nr:hypothetical protein [Streptomyces hayashii]